MFSPTEAEDFILELTRLVTQGSGIIPGKCQSRLSELVSSSQVAKHDRGVRPKVYDHLGPKTSPKITPKKLMGKRQITDESAGRQSVDEFNAISLHLDHINNFLTARYLEVTDSLISDKQLISLVSQSPHII